MFIDFHATIIPLLTKIIFNF